MTLHCIAIDDEPLALNLLKGFIERTPFLELKGSFLSAVEALDFIRHKPVDLIFSDIQLPDMDGIELARALEAEAHVSRIIFTTAYNQFALESYKVDALDYLLKPFDYDDFLKAAQKAERYQSLLNRAAGTEEEQYLFIRIEYQLVRVPLNDILYIEGLKDYAKISLKDTPKPLLTLMSLKALEEKLPAKRFMRVHRSFIASLDKINSVTRNTLHIGDRQVTIGEVYKEAFNQVTGKWLEKAE